MAELKTKATTQDPKDFLNKIEPEQKKADGLVLLEMFQKVTGEKAVMWGDSIVGFGRYHYRSERSTQEGDWPLVGFSPRKQNLTLYVMAGNEQSSSANEQSFSANEDSLVLLEKLGKHKKSGGCLYINELFDVDQVVLETLIEKSFKYMKKTNAGFGR